MQVNRRVQYSLRAMLEVARAGDGEPLPMKEIAERQCIPTRFLELIMSDLKRGGYVTSVRGRHGGYVLARPAEDICVGEVMAHMGWQALPVTCETGGPGSRCRLSGSCVFFDLWESGRQALSEVYDSTTFQDLVERDTRMRRRHARPCPT